MNVTVVSTFDEIPFSEARPVLIYPFDTELMEAHSYAREHNADVYYVTQTMRAYRSMPLRRVVDERNSDVND